jgi:hypothetical protein
MSNLLFLFSLKHSCFFTAFPCFCVPSLGCGLKSCFDGLPFELMA